MLMKRLSSFIRLNSAFMLQLEYLMTCFILGVVTSTFTEGVGIMDHITTDRGYSLPGIYFPQSYSGIELAKFDISVMLSTSDMRTIERIIKDGSTVPNFVVKNRKQSTNKNMGKAASERTPNAETRQAARVCYTLEPKFCTCRRYYRNLFLLIAAFIKKHD
jgi:hypothetical protein